MNQIYGTIGDAVRIYDKVKRTGRIFSVEFIKQNGEFRTMNCRTGVRKYVKGTGLKFVPLDRNLLSVFDLKKKEYRFINLETLKSITFQKTKYLFL